MTEPQPEHGRGERTIEEVGAVTSATPEDVTFDMICCECGKDIRLSRQIESGGMTVSFYVDELGLENTDFHFHVPH